MSKRDEERDKRLAEALRENLRRRKAQTKAGLTSEKTEHHDDAEKNDE